METDKFGYDYSANMNFSKFELRRFVLNVSNDLDWVSSEKMSFHQALVTCNFDKKYSELLCLNGGTRSLSFNTDTLKFVLAGIPTSEDDPFLSHGDCERF
jgi:hypothetical protein